MSTKKKALLTYELFALLPQLKMMLGFSVLLNLCFTYLSYFIDGIYPIFVTFPVTLLVFFMITVHKKRDGNWEKYTRSLPISAKEMVQAEYIYILVVAVISEILAWMAILSIKMSKEYELVSEISLFFVGIIFFYAVLPKICEVEKSLKYGKNTPSFVYLQGFFVAIIIHIAFFFATMIPLGFISNEGIYSTALLSLTTLGLTYESYKKSLYYAENLEY